MERLKRIAPYAALLLFTLLAYRTVLFTSDTFIPWDLPYYHVPQALFASESVRHGELPLWDPDTYCGRPLYAALNPAYFYPFRVLAVLIVGPSSQVNVFRALEVELVLHVFLAGIFTLWLARRLGMSEPAALLGAAAYELGFFFASQAEHIGFIEDGCWIPLALLGVILLCEKVTIARFALLSGTMALIVLSGFISMAVGAFAAIGLFAGFYGILHRHSVKPALLAIAAGAMAALLSAIQLVPGIELVALSIGHLRADWRGTGGGLPVEILKTLIRPNALGSLTGGSPGYEITQSYAYCGILVFALAVVAVFVKPSRAKFTLLALSVISCLGMLGDSTVVGKTVFTMLPAFIRGPYYPTSWMPVFSLCIALLGAYGLHLFHSYRRWGYVLVLLAAADLLYYGSAKPMNTGKADPGSIVLDRAIDGEAEALGAMREATAAHFPPYRIDGKGDNTWASWPLLTRVPSANGFDPLSNERLLRARLRLHAGPPSVLNTVETVEPKLLSLMNVRYFMTFEPLTDADLKLSQFTLSRKFPGRYLYENPSVLERFFFVSALTPSAGRDMSLELMNREDWDPARTAIVEGIDSPKNGLGTGTVKVVKYANQEVVLQAHADTDGFLTSSEVHYPGWQAYLDGASVPIHYSNVAFRGVFVPAGDHEIVYRFRPAVLLQGTVVTLLAAIALCVAVAFEYKRS